MPRFTGACPYRTMQEVADESILEKDKSTPKKRTIRSRIGKVLKKIFCCGYSEAVAEEYHPAPNVKALIEKAKMDPYEKFVRIEASLASYVSTGGHKPAQRKPIHREVYRPYRPATPPSYDWGA